VVVDALGNPLALSLTGGQVHDITQAEKLCAEVQPEALLADKGYDADGFITSLEVRQITAVIPPKANRKCKRLAILPYMPNEIWWNASSNISNNSEPSQHAMKRPPGIFSPDCIWSAPSLGSNEDTL
jgi:hypothetical protein